MSSFDCMDICRLCLIKEQVSVPIFGGEGDTRQIFLKISTCLPVKISRDDTLPKTICNNCVYRVESSYQFWNTTLNSEKQLLEWLNTSNVEQQQQQEQHIADKEFAADINNVAALLETENTTLETEQLMLKEEYLPDTSTTDLRYLHSRESNVVGIEERQEGVEEDDTDSCDDPAGEDDESDSEESGAETANQKTEIDDDVVEGENTTPLEPTTFVNVSLACDEPGPSGLQQQSGSITDGASTSAAVIPPGGCSNVKRIGRKPREKTIKKQKKLLKKIVRDVFKNFKFLKQESNGETKPLICNVCSLTFPTNSQYIKHVSVYHRKVYKDKYKCDICGKFYNSRATLRKHIVVHSGKLYACVICSKQFRKKSYVKTHMKIHSRLKTHACTYCGFLTADLTYLEKHCMKHTGKYEYYCDICNRGFASRFYIRSHMNIHQNLELLECSVCGKKFSGKINLNAHMRNVHSGKAKPLKRSFECDLCGKILSYRPSLNRHMRQHLGGGKNVLCDICGKVFENMCKLKIHRREHTGEKPFACKYCDKRFTRNEYLTLHERVHTKERPYQCEFCKKYFSQRGTLTIHLRYHTGERPYKCLICGSEFVCQSLLTLHRKSACI